MEKKKELITTTVALHPYQVALIRGLRNGSIDLGADTLRQIAKKCGDKKQSPQQAKHHIGHLVNLGAIQIIHGQYVYHNPADFIQAFEDMEKEIASFIDATDNKMLIKAHRIDLDILRRHRKKLVINS